MCACSSNSSDDDDDDNGGGDGGSDGDGKSVSKKEENIHPIQIKYVFWSSLTQKYINKLITSQAINLMFSYTIWNRTVVRERASKQQGNQWTS